MAVKQNTIQRLVDYFTAVVSTEYTGVFTMKSDQAGHNCTFFTDSVHDKVNMDVFKPNDESIYRSTQCIKMGTSSTDTICHYMAQDAVVASNPATKSNAKFSQTAPEAFDSIKHYDAHNLLILDAFRHTWLVGPNNYIDSAGTPRKDKFYAEYGVIYVGGPALQPLNESIQSDKFLLSAYSNFDILNYMYIEFLFQTLQRETAKAEHEMVTLRAATVELDVLKRNLSDPVNSLAAATKLCAISTQLGNPLAGAAETILSAHVKPVFDGAVVTIDLVPGAKNLLDSLILFAALDELPLEKGLIESRALQQALAANLAEKGLIESNALQQALAANLTEKGLIESKALEQALAANPLFVSYAQVVTIASDPTDPLYAAATTIITTALGYITPANIEALAADATNPPLQAAATKIITTVLGYITQANIVVLAADATNPPLQAAATTILTSARAYITLADIEALASGPASPLQAAARTILTIVPTYRDDPVKLAYVFVVNNDRTQGFQALLTPVAQQLLEAVRVKTQKKNATEIFKNLRKMKFDEIMQNLTPEMIAAVATLRQESMFRVYEVVMHPQQGFNKCIPMEGHIGWHPNPAKQGLSGYGPIDSEYFNRHQNKILILNVNFLWQFILIYCYHAINEVPDPVIKEFYITGLAYMRKMYFTDLVDNKLKWCIGIDPRDIIMTGICQELDRVFWNLKIRIVPPATTAATSYYVEPVPTNPSIATYDFWASQGFCGTCIESYFPSLASKIKARSDRQVPTMSAGIDDLTVNIADNTIKINVRARIYSILKFTGDTSHIVFAKLIQCAYELIPTDGIFIPGKTQPRPSAHGLPPPGPLDPLSPAISRSAKGPPRRIEQRQTERRLTAAEFGAMPRPPPTAAANNSALGAPQPPFLGYSSSAPTPLTVYDDCDRWPGEGLTLFKKRALNVMIMTGEIPMGARCINASISFKVKTFNPFVECYDPTGSMALPRKNILEYTDSIINNAISKYMAYKAQMGLFLEFQINDTNIGILNGRNYIALRWNEYITNFHNWIQQFNIDAGTDDNFLMFHQNAVNTSSLDIAQAQAIISVLTHPEYIEFCNRYGELCIIYKIITMNVVNLERACLLVRAVLYSLQQDMFTRERGVIKLKPLSSSTRIREELKEDLLEIQDINNLLEFYNGLLLQGSITNLTVSTRIRRQLGGVDIPIPAVPPVTLTAVGPPDLTPLLGANPADVYTILFDYLRLLFGDILASINPLFFKTCTRITIPASVSGSGRASGKAQVISSSLKDSGIIDHLSYIVFLIINTGKNKANKSDTALKLLEHLDGADVLHLDELIDYIFIGKMTVNRDGTNIITDEGLAKTLTIYVDIFKSLIISLCSIGLNIGFGNLPFQSNCRLLFTNGASGKIIINIRTGGTPKKTLHFFRLTDALSYGLDNIEICTNPLGQLPLVPFVGGAYAEPQPTIETLRGLMLSIFKNKLLVKEYESVIDFFENFKKICVMYYPSGILDIERILNKLYEILEFIILNGRYDYETFTLNYIINNEHLIDRFNTEHIHKVILEGYSNGIYNQGFIGGTPKTLTSSQLREVKNLVIQGKVDAIKTLSRTIFGIETKLSGYVAQAKENLIKETKVRLKKGRETRKQARYSKQQEMRARFVNPESVLARAQQAVAEAQSTKIKNEKKEQQFHELKDKEKRTKIKAEFDEKRKSLIAERAEIVARAQAERDRTEGSAENNRGKKQKTFIEEEKRIDKDILELEEEERRREEEERRREEEERRREEEERRREEEERRRAEEIREEERRREEEAARIEAARIKALKEQEEALIEAQAVRDRPEDLAENNRGKKQKTLTEIEKEEEEKIAQEKEEKVKRIEGIIRQLQEQGRVHIAQQEIIRIMTEPRTLFHYAEAYGVSVLEETLFIRDVPILRQTPNVNVYHYLYSIFESPPQVVNAKAVADNLDLSSLVKLKEKIDNELNRNLDIVARLVVYGSEIPPGAQLCSGEQMPRYYRLIQDGNSLRIVDNETQKTPIGFGTYYYVKDGTEFSYTHEDDLAEIIQYIKAEVARQPSLEGLAASQPSLEGLASSQPSFGGPAASHPSYSQSSFGGPAASHPSYSQSSFGGPAASQPPFSWPAASHPSYSQSSFGGPAASFGTPTPGIFTPAAVQQPTIFNKLLNPPQPPFAVPPPQPPFAESAASQYQPPFAESTASQSEQNSYTWKVSFIGEDFDEIIKKLGFTKVDPNDVIDLLNSTSLDTFIDYIDAGRYDEYKLIYDFKDRTLRNIVPHNIVSRGYYLDESDKNIYLLDYSSGSLQFFRCQKVVNHEGYETNMDGRVYCNFQALPLIIDIDYFFRGRNAQNRNVPNEIMPHIGGAAAEGRVEQSSEELLALRANIEEKFRKHIESTSQAEFEETYISRKISMLRNRYALGTRNDTLTFSQTIQLQSNSVKQSNGIINKKNEIISMNLASDRLNIDLADSMADFNPRVFGERVVRERLNPGVFGQGAAENQYYVAPPAANVLRPNFKSRVGGSRIKIKRTKKKNKRRGAKTIRRIKKTK
jgi:hypothetical protein